eukprot:14466283-Alexandrium_andersonii.AAC.1
MARNDRTQPPQARRRRSEGVVVSRSSHHMAARTRPYSARRERWVGTVVAERPEGVSKLRSS